MIRSVRSRGALAAFLATLWTLAYRGAPTAFDEWLALPIALERARPGTFNDRDLLVRGSVEGPFHLYKAASMLYHLPLDIDVAWYLLLVGSLLALFASIWRLGAALQLGEWERWVVVLAIAVSPLYRGTLNWSALPGLSFVSSSVALPLVLWALASALDDAPEKALILCAAAFDVHPSLGLCGGAAVLAASRFPLVRGRWTRALIGAALVGGPNVAYILMHRATAFAPFTAESLAVMRQFSYHVFVRDHWRDGYPWFAAALALALFGTDATNRRARRALLTVTVLAVGWIAAMNLTPSMSLLPLYLIRASLLAKPLLVMLGLSTLLSARGGGLRKSLLWGAALIAVAHPNPVVGEAALCLVLGLVFDASSVRGARPVAAVALLLATALGATIIGRHLVAPHLLDGVTDALRLSVIAVGGVGAAVAWRRSALSNGASVDQVVPSWRTLAALAAIPIAAIVLSRPAGRGWLPESPARIAARLRITRPLQREAGVMTWARDSAGPQSLFVIPPVAVEWVRFRSVAHQGVFVSVHDVNQLMYVPNFGMESVSRLRQLGVGFTAPHEFDDAPYAHPTCARLAAVAQSGATHYVVPVTGTIPTGAIVVYHDRDYNVIDLARPCRTVSSRTG